MRENRTSGSMSGSEKPSHGRATEAAGDSVIATAILDQLLHHNHIVNIRRESYRLREKKKAGLFGVRHHQGEVTQTE